MRASRLFREERRDRWAELGRAVEQHVMVCAGDLDQAPAPAMSGELARRARREDAAPFAAHEEHRASDRGKARTKIERMMGGEGRAVELRRPAPVGALAEALTRDVLEDLGRRVVLTREQREALDRIFERLVRRRAEHAEELHVPRASFAERGAAVDEDEGVEWMLRVEREAKGNGRAEGMSDDDRSIEPELIEREREIRRVVLESIGAVRRPRAVAVAAQVDGERTMARDEARRDEVPPVRMRGAAVDEDDRSSITMPVEEVETKIAARKQLIARRGAHERRIQPIGVR